VPALIERYVWAGHSNLVVALPFTY